MTKLLFIILSIISGYSLASDNLEKADYYGLWVSNRAAVKGEAQTLTIQNDFSSKFERTFVDAENQLYSANKSQIEIKEDLIIIKYGEKESGLRYKLVLSGWKSGDTKALYGTMFMYREGKQFNGLPVSFRSSQ